MEKLRADQKQVMLEVLTDDTGLDKTGMCAFMEDLDGECDYDDLVEAKEDFKALQEAVEQKKKGWKGRTVA